MGKEKGIMTLAPPRKGGRRKIIWITALSPETGERVHRVAERVRGHASLGLRRKGEENLIRPAEDGALGGGLAAKNAGA